MPEPDAITTVAILGAGTMGANIALSLAAHGVQVRMTDVNEAQLARGRATAEASACTLYGHGLLPEPVDTVIGRIACPAVLDEAIAGAGLVIEAVPEKLQLKLRVFMELERKTGPQVILASNTSTFMPSSLAVGLVNPATAARLVVMHYWNPAHLIPLVEVVPHLRALPEMVERVKALLELCGKHTVVLRKELPGFIGDRLAFALQREAIRMVESGVASAEEIDSVARAGFGRRIPVTGIFRTADFGGLDVYRSVSEQIFPSLCNDYAVPESLKRRVQAGMLGVKTREGWHKYNEREVEEWQLRLTENLVYHARADQRRSQPPRAKD
jgi:3-hydroxybutyryl-CoA dehydrogenase